MSNMAVLRPKAGMSTVVALVCAAAVVAAISAIWPALSGWEIEVLGIAALTSLCLTGLVLWDWQQRSVELNDDGASGMVWVRKEHPPFVTLARVIVPWNAVR